MTDVLTDYRRKRRWADRYFKSVEEAVQQFAKREPDLVPGEFDVGRSQYLFEFPRKLPEPTLALFLGDCVYNLRACLDYLMTALVRASGNQESYGTEFPIYDIPEMGNWQAVVTAWRDDPNGNIARKIRGSPPATKANIEKLQPFYGVPYVDPADHPLAFLKALSNRDKHRRLNVLVNRVNITFTDASGKPLFDGPEPHGSVSIPETSESDTQIVALTLSPDSPQTKMEMYLRSSYDVVFDEDGPIFDRRVIDTLTRIRKFVDTRVLPTMTGLILNP